MTKLLNLSFYSIIFLMYMIIFIFMFNYLSMNSLIIFMIIYSLLIFTIMSLWSKTYLYSIILFLTLISGLLIMFLYFMSLISNSKSSYTFNNPIIISFLLNMTIFFMFFQQFYHSNFLNSFHFYKPHNTNYPFYLTMMNSNIMNTPIYSLINEKMFLNITKIYLYPFNNITLLSMLFLLSSMFMVIKICSIKSSSLRKIN